MDTPTPDAPVDAAPTEAQTSALIPDAPVDAAPVDQAKAEQEAVAVLINAPRPVPSQELLAGVDDVEVKVAGQKTAPLVSVKFQANVGAYNPGEIAGFEQAVADKLVADGFATKE